MKLNTIFNRLHGMEAAAVRRLVNTVPLGIKYKPTHKVALVTTNPQDIASHCAVIKCPARQMHFFAFPTFRFNVLFIRFTLETLFIHFGDWIDRLA